MDCDRSQKLENAIEALQKTVTEQIELIKDQDAKIEKLSDKVDIYQTASQQVVNLAFSLIVGGTIAVIVRTVF